VAYRNVKGRVVLKEEWKARIRMRII